MDARKKLGAGGCADVTDGDGLEEETTVVDEKNLSVSEDAGGENMVHDEGIIGTLEGRDVSVVETKGGID